MFNMRQQPKQGVRCFPIDAPSAHAKGVAVRSESADAVLAIIRHSSDADGDVRASCHAGAVRAACPVRVVYRSTIQE